MSEPTKTPLHDRLEAMGGEFNDDSGWWWFATLGDVRAEYDAVREDVGVWDLSPLIKWRFVGPDAVKAANWVNANDIASLKVGGVHYGPFLNANGCVVDDGTIYKVRDDLLFVMTNSEEHGPYWAENTSQFDVKITNVAREMPHLAIQGPRSRELVQSLVDVNIGGLKYFQFIPHEVKLGAARGYLARTGFSGELGYEFFTHPEDMDAAFTAVVDQGGATPFGVFAIYILRLEAGLLIQGWDYDSGETNPFDAGLDKFVRMDKPDFVGKKALEPIAANPPNAYKTIKLASLPEEGAVVKHKGAEVGIVRGGAQESPRFGCLAGARIAKSAAADGTDVEVDGQKATVHPWGIYDPERKKPRS